MAYVASMVIEAHIQSKRVLIDDCSQCQAIVKKREVTWVICRNITPGRQKDYDDWLERYLTFQRKVPGYLGKTIIIPGGSKSSLWYIIHRFTDKAKMENWENSKQSLKLLAEVNNYSERHYDTTTGLETLFALPDSKTQISSTLRPYRDS